MITAFGHGDLTADALSRLEILFRRDLEQLPPGSTAVVRAGAGLPLAFGRAAHATGHPLIVILPSEQGLPTGLPTADREAASELLRLARLTCLIPYQPELRDTCVTADERILATCRHAMAVWDGSPSSGTDATAHLVAYGRGLGVHVEGLWSDALQRVDAWPCTQEARNRSRYTGPDRTAAATAARWTESTGGGGPRT